MNAVKIIRIIALILALVAAFVTIPYVTIAFIVLGLALGFMGVAKDERLTYLVFAIALKYFADALGGIPAVGEYLTAILTNFAAVVAAAGVAVVLMIIKERTFD